MFTQVADPVGGSLALSALVAALPLITLFVLLGGLRRKAWQAGLASLVVALGVAVFAFGMPAGQALLAASEGAAFGLFPIIWIVLTAIWVFKLTELTGYDLVLRQAFGSLSPDLRIQAIIIAFCFGALLEALAGFGTPVAVTAVMLLAVGLSPLRAATVTLVANTAPVAFGAIAVPITTLGKITGLDPHALGAMVGRQTPILALFVPLILVLMVDGRRGVRQTWPAALVGGGAFAVAQFVASNLLAYETADIVAAFAGALALVVLLRVWQPAEVVAAERAHVPATTRGATIVAEPAVEPLTARRALLAFAPYLVVVVLFTLASFGPLKAFLDGHSGWTFSWPGLHVLGSAGKPVSATTFTLNIFSAGGTVLLVSGLVTAAIYRLHPRRLVARVRRRRRAVPLDDPHRRPRARPGLRHEPVRPDGHARPRARGHRWLLRVPVAGRRLARRRRHGVGHVGQLALRAPADRRGRPHRHQPDPARRGQHVRRRARQDDLTAEPGHRRGGRRHDRPGE